MHRLAPAPSPPAVTPRPRGLRSVDPAAARPEPALVERAGELAALGRVAGRLAGGAGAVVVVDAPAGFGKTLLLDHVADLAQDAGALVRRAAPGPAERHFAYGVVRALLEAPVRDAPAADVAGLLTGPAAAAAALLVDGRPPDERTATAFGHSLLWLASALTADRSLTLVVDDAQWADDASLQALLYVARRIDDLPLLIVLAARAGDPAAPSDLLSLLGAVRGATVLHPPALTTRGAIELIRRHAPATPAAACHDCRRAVEGSPWLLAELARELAVGGTAALEDVRRGRVRVTPGARDVVRRRLATLQRRDRAVVAALAVLGEDAPTHAVAALAGVPLSALAPARDALAAAGLLAAGRERLAHGLVAAAVREELTAAEREGLHREAGRLLAVAGAAPDVVAGHLLACGPQADPEVTALLVHAADHAARHGAPGTAARYLERALLERAPGDDRGRMLTELATAAFHAGQPGSRGHLREALREVRDSDSRLDVLTHLSALQVIDGAHSEPVALLDEEARRETDPESLLAIEAAALDALMPIADRRAERTERVAAADPASADDPAVTATVLAHRAWVATERGTAAAAACAAQAMEAMAGDVLLREAARRSAYHLCMRVLIKTDHHAHARTAIDALVDLAVTRGSLPLRAAAAWYDGELALRTGRLVVAESAARTALELVEEPTNLMGRGALDVLLGVLIERGALDEAEALLRDHGLAGPIGWTSWEIGLRHTRARLHLARGDYDRAYIEAAEAGAAREEQGRPNPSWTPWRSTAALALAHSGRREDAVALADAELAPAERFGAPVPIVRALHARAVAEGDDAQRLALCRRALDIAEGASARLETVRVRLELGSTLARMGARVQARGALRPALADADAAGAAPLAHRARRELVATGLRPRHAAIEGAAALTPRQRQICALAAADRGNRAIAQELFLSIKTVETHLAAAYRKLGISTRAELGPALAR